MNIKVFSLSLMIGLISGVLSFYSGTNPLNNMYAGLIFGIFSMGLLVYFNFVSVGWWKRFVYIVLSGVGFGVAVAMSTTFNVWFIPGSILGVFFLGVGLLYIKVMTKKDLVTFLIIGGLLGLLYTFLIQYISSYSTSFFIFLLVWQTVIMIVISKFASNVAVKNNRIVPPNTLTK